MYIIVSALTVYKKSMIRYGPRSVYNCVPIRLCSNSWALNRPLVPLELRYILMAIVVLP
jgi:hypothetical protein